MARGRFKKVARSTRALGWCEVPEPAPDQFSPRISFARIICRSCITRYFPSHAQWARFLCLVTIAASLRPFEGSVRNS